MDLSAVKNSEMSLSNIEKKPFFFAISGYKNSGKTGLITSLIPELKKRGYTIAVIKHDGHDFEADVAGTDSYKHKAAGAYGTAVFSANRLLIHKECSGIDEVQIAKAFPEADIILLEGFKNSAYPKYQCRYPDEDVIHPKILADRIECLYKQFNQTKTTQ